MEEEEEEPVYNGRKYCDVRKSEATCPYAGVWVETGRIKVSEAMHGWIDRGTDGRERNGTVINKEREKKKGSCGSYQRRGSSV